MLRSTSRSAEAALAMHSFGSDNHCGVHPALMQALVDVNGGHAASYQTDAKSRSCDVIWQRHFGPVSVSYVFNGTAANVLALRMVTPGFGAVLCSDVAHLYQDAGASPEFMLGCRVQPVPSVAGKLTCEALVPFFLRAGDQHVPQPKALSLTQPTECGTVYTLDELRALCDFAHARGLLVHMDGARLVHAATRLGCSLRATTSDVGIDVVSFGGTKVGLMGGEAVLLFAAGGAYARAKDVKFVRKQLMQLPSKTRFIAAQFEALLAGAVWQDISQHVCGLAQRLAQALEVIEGVRVVYEAQVNMVFASFDKAWIKPLRRVAFFYVWQQNPVVVRLVMSFDTTQKDVDSFVKAVKALALGARCV